MPRRFFKKLAFKHTAIREQRALRPFRHLLGDHRLWQIRRKTVVPAFALGAFFAFMPFPGHPVWAMLAALWRRVNIPVAAITTLVSNPVTMPVMYYAAYRVGAYLLRIPPEPIEFEMSLTWVTEVLVEIWQPMLLGCILLGAIASLIAYAVLDLLWRRSVATYKLRKREQRHRREAKSKDHAG